MAIDVFSPISGMITYVQPYCRPSRLFINISVNNNAYIISEFPYGSSQRFNLLYFRKIVVSHVDSMAILTGIRTQFPQTLRSLPSRVGFSQRSLFTAYSVVLNFTYWAYVLSGQFVTHNTINSNTHNDIPVLL